MHLNDEICSVRYWLLSIGFGCIYIILALKLWRVNAVCGTMKRTVVTLTDVYVRFGVGMLILVSIVAVNQIMGITAVEVTTVDSQFSYKRELRCERSGPADVALGITMYVILSVGLYYCYRTKFVDSSLSFTLSSTRGIIFLLYFSLDVTLKCC